MRTIVSIRGPALPRHKRPELAAIYPQGMSDLGSFSLWLYEDDPRVAQVTEWLTNNGYRPGPKFKEHNRQVEYSLNRIREYDASDWEQAEYLEPYVPWEQRPDDGLRDGRRVIGGKDITEPRDFYLTWSGVLIAADATRSKLEECGLTGLSFAPVEVDPKGGNPFNHHLPQRRMPIEGMPFWEIVPTIKLPPLSPRMTLTDHKGNPLPPGDEAAHYRLIDGLYNNAELHFQRSDMDRIPEFDVARTRESFAQVPWTVVSSRFYRVCVEHGLRMNWAPVRIDPA